MIINRFTAKNVHGYLNFDIEIFEQLTFLIGINGSGKTSVIKLILGVISPSYNYLSQVEFEEVYLECFSKNEKVSIKAICDKKNRKFYLILNINDKISQSDSYTTNFINQSDDFDIDQISLIEKQQTELFEQDSIVIKIRQIFSIYFLGLDRKIYNGKNIDDRIIRSYYNRDNVLRRIITKKNGQNHLDNSLFEVQSMIYNYARRISKIQPRQNEIFKNQILTSIFKYNTGVKTQELIQLLSEDEVNFTQKKENVLKALESFQMKNISNSVEEFFNEMSSMIKEFKSVNEEFQSAKGKNKDKIEKKQYELISRWVINNSQLNIINEIIKLSDQAQKNKQKLYEPIEKFQNIITDFLKEGNKKMIIDEVGEIKVITSKNSNRTSIYQLSSGEKQLIIMIAYLIFDKEYNSSGIFIIDEPEISLHIAWQEIFVEAIIKANPKMQFILATHSPSIISKTMNEKYCQDINYLNI